MFGDFIGRKFYLHRFIYYRPPARSLGLIFGVAVSDREDGTAQGIWGDHKSRDWADSNRGSLIRICFLF